MTAVVSFSSNHRDSRMDDRRKRRLERMREGRKIWEEGLRTEVTVSELRRGDWLLEVPSQNGRKGKHFGGKILALKDGYMGVGIQVDGVNLTMWFPGWYVCIVMKERKVRSEDQIRCLVCLGNGVIRPECKCAVGVVCECPYILCPNPGCEHRAERP